MRFRYLSALVLLSLLLFSNTQGQGSFQNLGFESGIIVPVPGDPFGRIEFAPALPGWSGYVGNQTQTVVFYNNLFLGSPGIGLVGTNFGVINGQYSLVLQGGSAPGSPDVSISQSGMIPNGTRSLRFKAYDLPSIFKASLNGQSIDLLRLSDVDHIITYGGDISGFSGQNAELDLTAASGLPGSGNLWLDSISFSTQLAWRVLP